MAAPVHTVVCRQLGELAGAWDALVLAAPLPSPFLRSWWLEATAGEQPCFVLVLDRNELVGGLALEEDGQRPVPRLRAMGAGPLCPDHLDLVAQPGREDDVVAALAAWLARPGSRVIELEGLVEQARVAAALPTPVRRRVIDSAPWAPLPADLDDYLASRPSRLVNSTRRAERRLARVGARHELVVAPDGAPDVLDDLLRLHTARWRERSQFAPAFARFRVAALDGLARRELVLHRIVVGDRTIAVQAWFELAGRVAFYQGGRDLDAQWRGAGNVLHLRVAERAYELGFREIDLLRGAEAYKSEWAERSRVLVGLKAAHGVGGRLAWAGELAWGAGARVRARVSR